jgi:hypothetical protein
MDDVERLRSCVNMPYFTVFTPLQNIINPVKKDLFLYKSLDQNLVPMEATEGISEDSFLKSSSRESISEYQISTDNP